MQVILPLIMARASLELPPGAELDLEPSITLRPRAGLPMTLRSVT